MLIRFLVILRRGKTMIIMDAITLKTEDSKLEVDQVDPIINSHRSELVEVKDSTISICRALMRYSETFSVVTIHLPTSLTMRKTTSLVAVLVKCAWDSADIKWEVK